MLYLMELPPFALERTFAASEFNARFLLGASDCQSLTLNELLSLAGPESARLWRDLSLGYTETAGHPLLRAEVADMYREVPASGIVIAAPEEAIFIAMNVLLSPGDHVICLAPAYPSLHEIARAIGCRVTLWWLRQGDHGWELDLEALRKQITPETRLLVINFPHNPTGFQPSAAEHEQILKIAANGDLIVFSDEMYRLLEDDPQETLAPVCDQSPRGISLSGLSKSLSAPGLRIGWLATSRPDWISRFIAFKDYTTICAPAPSEILALMVLQQRETILARNRLLLRENRAHADRFFSRHRDRFHWLPPLAGPVAFPAMRSGGDAERFCQELLRTRGVLVIAGHLFGFAGQHFRVGLGRKDFPVAITEVDRFLAEQGAESRF